MSEKRPFVRTTPELFPWEARLVDEYASHLTPYKDEDLPEFLRNPRSSKVVLFYGFHLRLPKEWKEEDYRKWVERVSKIIPKPSEESEKPEGTKVSDDPVQPSDLNHAIDLFKTRLEYHILEKCMYQWCIINKPSRAVTSTDDMDNISVALYTNRLPDTRMRQRLAADTTTRDEALEFIRSALGLGDDVEPMWYFDADVHGPAQHHFAPFKGRFLRPPRTPESPTTPKARPRNIAE
ncbi:hypothetical protein C8Q80DRAFT_751773 [Daedaleopsis nitida]|nr:hypothetical protein C8Q80DRAFT_751773 [Daedaleopsis nitida]